MSHKNFYIKYILLAILAVIIGGNVLLCLIFAYRRIADLPYLELTVDFNDSDIIGTWSIEDPKFYLNNNSDKFGWQKTKLTIKDGGDFMITDMTIEQKAKGFFPHLPETANDISGKWRIHRGKYTYSYTGTEGLQYRTENYATLILEPDNDIEFIVILVFMFDSNQKLKINWKFRGQTETLHDKGMIWHKTSQASN